MTKISLGVCILFFEKTEQTINCIDSFLLEECNLYILNNGSNFSSFEKIKSKYRSFDNIKFFNSDRNLGCPGGRTFLINNTNEDWLVFPDSDITVETADWYDILKQEIEANSGTEVFVPKLYNVHENSFATFNKLELVGSKIIESHSKPNENPNWFPGGAAFVKRHLFEEVGCYDPNLFCFEDYELGIRMLKQQRKLNLSFIKDIIFKHDHRFQSKQLDKNAVKARYNHKKLEDSLLYLCDKYSIEFEHYWQYWTNSQIEIMTKSKKKQFIERALLKLVRIFK